MNVFSFTCYVGHFKKGMQSRYIYLYIYICIYYLTIIYIYIYICIYILYMYVCIIYMHIYMHAYISNTQKNGVKIRIA